MSENKAKASDVAAGFIQYYYTSLSNGVDNVLKCYAEESTVKLFDNDAVTGLKVILFVIFCFRKSSNCISLLYSHL